MSYEIDDAKERASAYPETFERASNETIAAKLAPGVCAKILFHCKDGVERHSERMWVRVLRREGDWWVGELANEPLTIPPEILDFGDIVAFETRHVVDIDEEA